MIYTILISIILASTSVLISYIISNRYYTKMQKELATHYLALRQELKPDETLVVVDDQYQWLKGIESGEIRLSDIPFEKRIQYQYYYFLACEHDIRLSGELYQQDIQILKKDLRKSESLDCDIDRSMLELLCDKEIMNIKRSR